MRSLALLSMLTGVGCVGTSPMDLGPDANTVEPTVDAAPVDGAAPVTSMYVHTRDTLYKIDDRSFDLVFVGPFNADYDITDLAVTPDGELYGISTKSLYSVDRSSGQATYLVDVPGAANVGLTFLPGGKLLATDKEGGVREVDPKTGDIEEIGEFGSGYRTAGDLVAVADGSMYAIGETPDGKLGDPNILLSVSTLDGLAIEVGGIGYGNVFGTAYANGKVYAFTSQGEVIEIERNNGTGILVREYPTMSFWGAAVSPLVSVD